jgi:hypothetical protein
MSENLTDASLIIMKLLPAAFAGRSTAEGAIQSFDHFCTERRLGECVQAFSSYALFYNRICYFHHAEDPVVEKRKNERKRYLLSLNASSNEGNINA